MSLALEPASARTQVPVVRGELDPRAVERHFVPQVRPWESDDLTRLVVFQGVAMAIVAVAWWTVSGTADLEKQMLWLRIGVSGVVLSGVANGVWLMRGRRLVGLARRIVLEQFEPVVAAAREQAVVAGESRTSDLVAVAGTGRFHARGCPLVGTKDTVSGDRVWHIGEGRTACEACCP